MKTYRRKTWFGILAVVCWMGLLALPRTAGAVTYLTGDITTPQSITNDWCYLQNMTNNAAGTITMYTDQAWYAYKIYLEGVNSISGDITMQRNALDHSLIWGFFYANPGSSTIQYGGNVYAGWSLVNRAQYTLQDGTITLGNWFPLMANGSATFTQNGGTCTVENASSTGEGGVDVGGVADAAPVAGQVGVLILSNGVLRTSNMLVGRLQNGGSFNTPINYGGVVVQEAGSSVLINGSLGWSYDYRGHTGYSPAAFDISQPNASSVSAPESSYTFKGGTLSIPNGKTRIWPYGRFEGYGTVSSPGQTLNNCGKVVANGFGVDRALDLSSYGTVAEERTNGTERADDGWYAVNHGKLILPSLAASVGSQTLNWGEAQTNSTLTMVNSVQLSNFAVTTTGTVSISLLATNNSEASLATVIHPIGVWSFASAGGLAFNTVDLAFRYDDALAASLGVTPSQLQLFQYVTGKGWKHVAANNDASTHIMSTTGVTALSPFVIAERILPAGTIISIR